MIKKMESPLIRGLCVICGKNPQTARGKDKKGRTKYRALCSGCHRRKYGMQPSTEELVAYLKSRGYDKNRIDYRDYKLDYCECCGFIPVHKCQLDVDHIDGNHKNNSRDNLQTLCANCHRLKTFLNGDGIYKVVED